MKKERKSAYLVMFLLVMILALVLIFGPHYLGSTVEDINRPAVIDNASFLMNSQYSINLNDYFPGAASYTVSGLQSISGVIENGVLILTSQQDFAGTERAKVTAYYENEEPVESNEFTITVEAPKGGDVGIASLPGDVSSCQVIDYTPGIYTLDRNLSASGNCFNVIVGDVTINCQGNSITGNGSGDGIYLAHVNNVIIENCGISNFTNGINVYNSSNNSMIGNAIFNNSNIGLSIAINSSNNILKGNTLNNNNKGILVLNSPNNTLLNNSIFNHTTPGLNYGINISFSSGNNLTSNVINENDYGIFLLNSSNSILNLNSINGNSVGIPIFNSDNITITSNLITNNSNEAILGFIIFNLTIYNNTIDRNNYGIVIYGDEVSLVKGNISKNIIKNHLNYGISIDSDNYNIENNIIFNNYEGISFVYTNNSLITGNVIDYNGDSGIMMSNSFNNTIFLNLIRNNTNRGILVTSNSYLHNISFNNVSGNGVIDIDILVDAGSDKNCNNIIINNTGSGDRPILYYNSSVTIENKTLAELILCNADNSNITNVTVKGGAVRNNGFVLTRTNNSVISNSTSINNYWGFLIKSSPNNTLNGTIIDNAFYSIYVDGSSPNNKFVNVSVVNAYPSSYDIYLDNANGTELIDTRLGKYSITSSLVTFENTKYGKIKFKSTIIGDGLNLSSDVRISNNSVYVNASETGLNESANITLYNLKTNFARPAILRDGGLCPSSICRNLTSLNAGTVVFNVTRWSNYSIDEGFDEISICRKLNVSDTIYKLNSSAVTNFTCFNVTATNVTIDCGNWGNRIIYGNSSSSTTYYGVYSNSTKTTVKNCEITMGERADVTLERYAIYYYESSNGTIYNVNASNNRQGIVMEGTSSQNNITNNIASFNEQTGIYLITNIGNKIMNNIANNNKFGIRIYWQSDDNLIQDNTANNNREAGFYFGPDANNNTIKSNNAVNNSYGIILQDGNYSIFDLNKIRNNNYGLFLNASNRNNLTSNELNNNLQYGVYLFSSNNSFIFNNTIKSNNYGINILASRDNNIYNNFFNNTILNANATGINNWNKTKTAGINIINGSWIGGNFWSDYNGSDLNRDGIGNTLIPYNASNNIAVRGDYLPLGGSTENYLPNITKLIVNSTFGTNYTNEDLTCWINATDLNGDNVIYEGYWYRNGISNIIFNTSPTNYTPGILVNVSILLNGNLSIGENWSCKVRAFDGYNYSAYMMSNNVTILNIPPNITQVIVNSTFGTNLRTENFTCWAKASDVDGNKLNYSGSWYKNGIINQSFNAIGYSQGILANVSTLKGSLTSVGENWSCNVRAFDGYDYSNYLLSNNVTILNTLPTIAQVFVNSTFGTNLTNENLMCWVNATDLDGDKLNYSGSWYKDGILNFSFNATGYSQGILVNVSTLDSSLTSVGENWSCDVRAFDGYDYSNYLLSNNVTILNSPPTIAQVFVNSTFGTNLTNENLICWAKADDVDLDNLNYSGSWYKDGILNFSFNATGYSQGILANVSILDSSLTSAGEKWSCSARAYDGYNYSNYLLGENLTILPVCGNLVCEAGEDCSSCPGDCGSCPSGGGGGGGGGGYDTFTPSESQLNSGYSNSYSKSDRMRFTFGGGFHYIILNTIGTNSVTVTIKSLPMTVVLWLGEPKKVDINDDGIYDLLLRLDRIYSSRTADIFVQRIYESVYVAPAPTPAPEVPPAEIPPAPVVPPAAEEKGISTGTVIIISLAVLIVLVAIIIVIKVRKERIMVETGKRWVEDAKGKGYSSKEINRILHEREWNREHIKKVMEKEKKKR
jgi:parallel beta-helix repeat protein